MRPLVTAVVPSYNHARYVGATIESLLRQTRPPDELLVVDDGSQDGTIEVLRSFGDRIAWTTGPNRGVGATYNEGIARARGEILAFVESDDLVEPTYLEETLAHLERHPALAWISTARRIIDEQGRPTGRMEGKRSGDLEFTTESLLRWDLGFCATPVVRRDALLAVGPYDTSSYAADVDMSLRFSLHHRMGYLERPLYLYRRHAENASGSGLRNVELVLEALDRFSAAHPGWAREHDLLVRAARSKYQGMIAAMIFEHRLQARYPEAYDRLRDAVRGDPHALKHRRRYAVARVLGPRAYGSWRRFRERNRHR